MYYEYNFDMVNGNMGGVKALFNIVFEDCFMVSNCQIRESSNGNLFVLMPDAAKDKNGYVQVKNNDKKRIFTEILNDYKLGQKKVCHKVPDKMTYKVNVNYIGQDNLKAFCSLELGFVNINGIRALKNKDDKLFVSMPGVKTDVLDKDGKPTYKYVANPITNDFYVELNKNILSVYNELFEREEPDEIKLLTKTIEEYTEMISKINCVDIPKYINDYRYANSIDYEIPLILLGQAYINVQDMQESIFIATHRVQELRNQLRLNGAIDQSFSNYDNLFEGISGLNKPMAPTQNDLFFKNMNEQNKKK